MAGGSRIYRLYLCRKIRATPPKIVLDMTLNFLKVRPKCWRFEKYGVPLLPITTMSTLIQSGRTC